MSTLRISLLGEFRLMYEDTPLSQITSHRVQALVAYLVLHRDRPQPRQQLAYLLWPDTTDAQARTNLRQLLHTLRQTLPDTERFLLLATHTLQWQSDAPFRLDVAAFEQALTQAAEAERRQDAPILRTMLEQAVALYKGDLLPSCYDDWILPERERLRQAYAGALERLVALLDSLDEPRTALPYAQRLLRHDPLREESYRDLMRLCAACGDRAGVQRVYQTCVTVLERELGIEPSAATREAYARWVRAEAKAPTRPISPPSPSSAPAATNLPVQLTSFVGRARELAEVRDLLQTTRLLTLTGPGGTGKTRLALEVAAKVLDVYPNGVWLVEFAPLADPTLVIQTIAATLGVREQLGRPILDALLDYLRAKTLLLILDNCEHLIETCAQMAETLLRAAPNLRILASSREALGIAGEITYRVPPLALPDPGRLSNLDRRGNLDALAQNDSVHLFVDRASTVYPPFRLNARNAAAIAQIGRRLDGIPLAIELAAARAKVLPPEQIAARLDDRFRLLTGGSRTALPRHQTLLALIEWSHHLLTTEERVLLRRLSAFAGSWSLEAAQAVCGDGLPDGLGADVLETLARLVDKSLVEVDVEGAVEAAEGRYRLLETIRQYARDKLLEAGEAEQVRDRHLDFFLRFAEETEPKLRSVEQLRWLYRLETEHDNLRTALAWALEGGASERALRLAGALGYFWELRGYLSEGHNWLDEALARSERERRERVALGEPSLLTHTETARRAKALYGIGMFRFAMRSDPAAARRSVEEGLGLWRELGDKWGMAVALALLGLMLAMEGDIQTSLARVEEGVSLAREVEDRWPLAMCLIRFGDHVKGTDLVAARRALEEGVTVARSVGDRSVLSEGLRELGYLYALEGDLSAAARVGEEALVEARAIRSMAHLFLALLQLALNSCFQNDPEKAKRYCIEAWALARESGSQMAAWFVLLAFGVAACFGGHLGRGVRLLAASDAFARQRGLKLTVENDPTYGIIQLALEKARTQLDPATFEAAWIEGEQMTVEQAIALATEDESQKAPLPETGR